MGIDPKSIGHQALLRSLRPSIEPKSIGNY
jgi:hypothetical protein